MIIKNMINAVDLHACGEPGRVITGGILDVPGNSMFDKMKHLSNQMDSLRLMMLREPRGYPASNCSLLLPSNNPNAIAGYVIMEQTEYPGMSGTNTICVATALIECGLIEYEEPVSTFTLESPAGLINVTAEIKNGKVLNVTFENVPAFCVHSNVEIKVPEIGKIKVDVAYGGMFYVIMESSDLGVVLNPENGGEIVRKAEMVKAIAAKELPVVHPNNEEINGITIAVVSGPPSDANSDLKNAVVVSTGILDWDKPATWKGAIDRSPCGTGTCAKMASLYEKNKLSMNQEFVHEGILGTKFTGRLIRKEKVGKYNGLIPTITGRAWITGFAQYVVDESDPFPNGYTVGDIWGGS